MFENWPDTSAASELPHSPAQWQADTPCPMRPQGALCGLTQHRAAPRSPTRPHAAPRSPHGATRASGIKMLREAAEERRANGVNILSVVILLAGPTAGLVG